MGDKCATHIDLEDGPPSKIAIMSRRGFMDHGFMLDSNRHCPRFPSSRDWNMPTVKCSRRTCVANYGGKCTMPSLIEIGPKGCKGYHKRTSEKKK